jgi:hypothetical protein
MRIVGEAVADGLQADIIVIDRAGGDHAKLLFWEGQPVARFDLAVDVEVQVLQKVAAQREDRVIGLTVPEARRQSLTQGFADGITVAGMVIFGQEEQYARLPVVILRHLVVEAQDL